MTLLVCFWSPGTPRALSDAPVESEVIARTDVCARAAAGSSAIKATLTLIAVSDDDDEWLRSARRVLVNRPGTIGLIPLGKAVDSPSVSLRLAAAMNRLTGQLIGLFPRWRDWRRDGGAIERAGVAVLHPPAQSDLAAALAALEEGVARARVRFAHVVIDLAGLPLRHPTTLGCADVLVTLAASGAVREDHLLAIERLLPDDRHLGVMLID
jgi:hypothetical protein